MNAFSAAMSVIFNDPNMAVDVLYLPKVGRAATIRAIRTRPQDDINFGESRIQASGFVFEVQASDVGEPRAGDILSIGNDRFEVQGKPTRDVDGLVWTLNTRPFV